MRYLSVIGGLVFFFGIAQGAERQDTITANNLEELVVTGESASRRLQSLHMGAEALELSKMSLMPVLFGENDIIKSITYLPGVHSEGDGAGGFEVRGGTSAQNLIQLDGMTLYSPTHVMGIFSTFNDLAIGNATLYKGPVPAWFGEASSSVLESSLSSGDMERYHATGTIGILAAKLMAGGPVVKDKLSFKVTARRSYVDAFLKMVPKYRDIVMNFYDITAKVRFIANGDHMIDGSFIASRDDMAIGGVMGMNWGNVAGSLNWLARKGDSWDFRTIVSYTSFSNKMGREVMEDNQELKEYIRNLSLNENVSFAIDDDRKIDFGYRSEFLRVKSADFMIGSNQMRDVRSGWVNALWANFEGPLWGNLSLSGGIRMSIFTSLTGHRFHSFQSPQEQTPVYGERTYITPEPRLSIKWDIDSKNNLKIGISRSSQDLHSIRSSTTSFPFDRYAISSANVKPENAWQYSAGYTGMTSTGGFDWSAEVYYKTMDNVYDFRDGCSMFTRLNLESIIAGGKGRSYGAEFMVRKNMGHLSGWISYSISKTETKIAEINDGRWYNATNDRRNDLSVVGLYRFNDRWNVSASWVWSSGVPLTAPDVKYELSGTTIYYYSRRNGYRTPDTHRLDIAATYTHIGKKLTYEWNFGIYNVYNRYNPYVVYFEDDPTKPSGSRAVLQAMYGLVPSVSYTLKF